MMFFNFRADRAREMTRALADPSFHEFIRKPLDPHYTTMTRYSDDFNYPVVFPPRALDNILAEVISKAGLTQFRIAETEKYAHVTYFFNGGEETPFTGETRALVASPKVATYDQQPEMSALGVAERALDALDENYSFILLNFANPDMVGHTGNLEAAIKALETLDPLVKELVEKGRENGYTIFITADHGNCEQMFDENGGPFTAHTTNLVPFVVITPDDARVALKEQGILADVAPTILKVLNLSKPAEMEGKSIIL
jgi:2,3-bisphosphoglycerate-independent phosphoglycerate mutase